MPLAKNDSGFFIVGQRVKLSPAGFDELWGNRKAIRLIARGTVVGGRRYPTVKWDHLRSASSYAECFLELIEGQAER